MLNLGYTVVFFLSVGTHASADAFSTCGVPPSNSLTKPLDKYSQLNEYDHGEMVIYKCAEGYTETRGIRSIKCVDGKWTRLSLKCEKKMCGSAGDLFNGHFDYTGSFSGDKAYAVCNDGFTLKGMKYRLCKDSVWTGEFPTCEEGREPNVSPVEITCPYHSVANSVHLVEAVYRVRDSVTIECSEGFILTGEKQITCGLDGQWQPQLPQCLPSVKDITCTPPKTRIFTVVTGLKEVYRPQDSLSFSCTGDYILNGSKTVTCGLKGKWNPPLPNCKLIRCPTLRIKNGRKSTNNRTSGSEVIITCCKGRRLNREARIVCSPMGKWMGEIPLCVPVGRLPQTTIPAEITCPYPSVANSVNLVEAVYRVRDSVTIVCSVGFLLTGDKQITCGPDGQWKPQLPQCLPSSNTRQTSTSVGKCGVPPEYPNRHLYQIDRKRTVFRNGEKVKYSCEIGYVRVKGVNYSTCKNGKWTPLNLRCDRKSCGSAGEIDFGHFEYSGVEFGDTATGVCNEGYQLVGQNVRNCMNDGWDGRVPVCEPVRCDDPPMVINAEMHGYLEPPYTYSQVISYRCLKGELRGSCEIYCTKDGTWTDPPECFEGSESI